jgi:hypothetical protein
MENRKQTGTFMKADKLNSWITHILGTLLVLSISCAATLAAPYTPKAGTGERKAIADGMRRLLAEFEDPTGRNKIVFKVDFMRVDGNYAAFEGVPEMQGKRRYEDDPGVPDAVFFAVLRRSGSRWDVIEYDQRGDVISVPEMRQFFKKLPREVPLEIFPEPWQTALYSFQRFSDSDSRDY